MSTISAPANTNPASPIRDIRTTVFFLPVEVGEGNGDDHFWLISFKTEWHEAGRDCTQHQLRLRCRHCDFGYNSDAFVTVRNLVRMSEEADRHLTAGCPRSGRTLDLISPEIKH